MIKIQPENMQTCFVDTEFLLKMVISKCSDVLRDSCWHKTCLESFMTLDNVASIKDE